MPGKKVLIIDDDIVLLRLLEQAFMKAGYQVYTAVDGEEGLRQFFLYHPNMVILDIILPTMDGWETYHRIRRLSNLPLIIITGRGSEEDNIISLKEGADEYLVKPFDFDILLAKVEAILRRAALPESSNTLHLYCDDHLAINLIVREVLVGGQLMHLSPKEYELLVYLVQRADQIIPHDEILRAIWNLEGHEHIRNVHLYIGRLRQKVEVDSRQPCYILTVSRIGYRFKKQIRQ